VIRERGIQEFRFTVNECGFSELMDILEALKKAEPDELV
jgi:hypothetical protein